jgi:hypothetical protein
MWVLSSFENSQQGPASTNRPQKSPKLQALEGSLVSPLDQPLVAHAHPV